MGGRQGGNKKLKKTIKTTETKEKLRKTKKNTEKLPPLSPQTVFSDVKRQNPLIPPLKHDKDSRNRKINFEIYRVGFPTFWPLDAKIMHF